MEPSSSARRFDGSSVMITGGGVGIGFATARRLYDEGASVMITDRDGPGLDRALTAMLETGGDAERLAVAVCDVTETPSVQAAVRATVERFGGLDVVVNVAGGSHPHDDFEDLSEAEWDSFFDLNLKSVLRTVRAAAPELRRSRRAPAVINVTSVNALGAWGDEPYSAAKAALINFTSNLAVRYGPDGIRVSAVAPGTIRTPNWDNQPGALEVMQELYPLGRVGEPTDVAAAIAFLASPDAAWITGVTLPVDGGGSAGPFHLMRRRFAEF